MRLPRSGGAKDAFVVNSWLGEVALVADAAATITVSYVDRTAGDPEAQTPGFSIDKA